MTTNIPGAAESQQETPIVGSAGDARKPYQSPRIVNLGPVEVVTRDGGGGAADLNGTSQI